MLKHISFCFIAVALFCLLAAPVAMSASGAMALVAISSDKGETEAVIPEDATPEQVREILAGMSDEQARRLLIAELQNAVPAASAKAEQPGLVGAIVKAKSFLQQVRERFSALFTGAASAPRLLPDTLLKSLSGQECTRPDISLSALQSLLSCGFRPDGLWAGAWTDFASVSRTLIPMPPF